MSKNIINPKKRCEQIVDFLIQSDHMFLKDLNTKKLAQMHDLTHGYLTKIFREFQGISLREFLNRVKLLKISLLMQEKSKLSASDINLENFIIPFKDFFSGVTSKKMNLPDERVEDIVNNLITCEPVVFIGLNVKVLAKIYCVNCSHLSRTFKKHTGVNLSEYIKRLRLTKSALMLMENRNIKVYQIAELFGWDRSDYYINSFRKFFGVTPGKFRDFIQ